MHLVPSFDMSKKLKISLIVSSFIILTIIGWVFPWRCYYCDLNTTYFPSARLLLAGKSPFTPTFYNAPWLLIPVIPFALLPEKLAGALWFACNCMGLVWIAKKMGGKPITILLVFVSYPVYHLFSQGQIDILVYAGYLLPPKIGLLLVLAKPQIGIAVAAYWAFEAFRAGGIKKLIVTFLPVTAAYLVTFVFFGLYPLNGQEIIQAPWNLSFWPFTLLFGLVLLVRSIRLRDLKPAIMASPMFSPYVAFYSWGGVFLALIEQPLELLVLVIATWGMSFLHILP